MADPLLRNEISLFLTPHMKLKKKRILINRSVYFKSFHCSTNGDIGAWGATFGFLSHFLIGWPSQVPPRRFWFGLRLRQHIHHKSAWVLAPFLFLAKMAGMTLTKNEKCQNGYGPSKPLDNTHWLGLGKKCFMKKIKLDVYSSGFFWSFCGNWTLWTKYGLSSSLMSMMLKKYHSIWPSLRYWSASIWRHLTL